MVILNGVTPISLPWFGFTELNFGDGTARHLRHRQRRRPTREEWRIGKVIEATARGPGKSHFFILFILHYFILRSFLFYNCVSNADGLQWDITVLVDQGRQDGILHPDLLDETHQDRLYFTPVSWYTKDKRYLFNIWAHLLQKGLRAECWHPMAYYWSKFTHRTTARLEQVCSWFAKPLKLKQQLTE